MLVKLSVVLDLDDLAYDSGYWSLDDLVTDIEDSIVEVLSREEFGDKWDHSGWHDVAHISYQIIHED